MRKLLFTLLLITVTSLVFCQNRNAILQESFDSPNLPSGWSIYDDGASNWIIALSDIAGGIPNELQFGWTPIFSGTTRVIAAPVNLTGISSATLSFKHYVDVYEGSATIGFATSSDNGSTWNTAWSKSYDTDGNYEVFEIFDSPDMGKDNVLICLFFEGSSYNINFWYFDDIEILSQNQIDINLVGIDNHDYVLYGENQISFTVQNMGESNIESFEASYTLDGDTFTESFQTDISPMGEETFIFSHINDIDLGTHELSIDIISVNNSVDENDSNNHAAKEMTAVMALTQKIAMIEHFSSSTCGPCVEVNALMKELTTNNPGKYTYVKYAMNWPAIGDLYYTSEGEVRKVLYDVRSVPTLILDGSGDIAGVVTQDDIDRIVNTPSIADIRASFTMEGSTIKVIADILSYIELQGFRAFISVNEKTTTENASSNGETEFHHIMMKMLEDAEGNEISIAAGEYQRLEFSHDMSTTHVEDINDLEVALWLQNLDTKEIINSRFAYEYCEHVYPINNLKLENNIDKILISWDAPQNDMATGYNIYINGELVKENHNDLSHEYTLTENGLYCVEVVALYNEKSSVAVADMIDAIASIDEENITTFNIYPNPASDFVKITAHGSQLETIKIYNSLGMLVEEIEVSADEVEINTSEYKSGIYFIQVYSDNKTTNKKVIKL